MPFIKQEDRFRFDIILKDLPLFNNKGELEYCIYKLMKHYMSDREVRYNTLHECVYAATHCADEFRRLHLDKREDEARETNGDVYA